jgi:hypothetical protein
MTSVQYHSAVYKLNRSKQTATKIGFKNFAHDILPASIEFSELANMISTMQKKCFKDNNENNENTGRIMGLFTSGTDRTVAVVVSFGYLSTAANYMDFVDGGSATIQKSKQDFLERQQPWINEVCRAKILADASYPMSPIKIVMDLIDIFITTHMMKQSETIDGSYLYVEKHPEHGNPDFLLDYYSAYGYVLLPHTDDEYFYMRKAYDVRKKSKRTTKANRVSAGSARSKKKYA